MAIYMSEYEPDFGSLGIPTGPVTSTYMPPAPTIDIDPVFDPTSDPLSMDQIPTVPEYMDQQPVEYSDAQLWMQQDPEYMSDLFAVGGELFGIAPGGMDQADWITLNMDLMNMGGSQFLQPDAQGTIGTYTAPQDKVDPDMEMVDAILSGETFGTEIPIQVPPFYPGTQADWEAARTLSIQEQTTPSTVEPIEPLTAPDYADPTVVPGGAGPDPTLLTEDITLEVPEPSVLDVALGGGIDTGGEYDIPGDYGENVWMPTDITNDSTAPVDPLDTTGSIFDDIDVESLIDETLLGGNEGMIDINAGVGAVPGLVHGGSTVSSTDPQTGETTATEIPTLQGAQVGTGTSTGEIFDGAQGVYETDDGYVIEKDGQLIFVDKDGNRVADDQTLDQVAPEVMEQIRQNAVVNPSLTGEGVTGSTGSTTADSEGFLPPWLAAVLQNSAIGAVVGGVVDLIGGDDGGSAPEVPTSAPEPVIDTPPDVPEVPTGPSTTIPPDDTSAIDLPVTGEPVEPEPDTEPPIEVPPDDVTPEPEVPVTADPTVPPPSTDPTIPPDDTVADPEVPVGPGGTTGGADGTTGGTDGGTAPGGEEPPADETILTGEEPTMPTEDPGIWEQLGGQLMDAFNVSNVMDVATNIYNTSEREAAAKQMRQATERGQDIQQEMFDASMSAREPYMVDPSGAISAAGYTAPGGLPTPDPSTGDLRSMLFDPDQLTDPSEGVYGGLPGDRPMPELSEEDYWSQVPDPLDVNNPIYQAMLAEGNRNLTNVMGARGKTYSGETEAALYNQGIGQLGQWIDTVGREGDRRFGRRITEQEQDFGQASQLRSLLGGESMAENQMIFDQLSAREQAETGQQLLGFEQMQQLGNTDFERTMALRKMLFGEDIGADELDFIQQFNLASMGSNAASGAATEGMNFADRMSDLYQSGGAQGVASAAGNAEALTQMIQGLFT